MYKLIILVALSIFIIGCGDPTPVPESAVKACLDKGWIPYYYSNSRFISFKCTKCEDCLDCN